MARAADFTGALTVNGEITVSNSPNRLVSGTLTANGDLNINGGTFQVSTFHRITVHGDNQAT